MIIHLVDGTYELFRHFYGIRRFKKTDPPYGAVSGVLSTVVQLIDDGATHVGVATDHIIESFRNTMWAGYKTGAGIERALRAQFEPLEEALEAMGVTVWAMVELEADDALASAAHLAAQDSRVEKICIWTPDKDLAQCVRGSRVVQMIRKGNETRDEAGVIAKFGVPPASIPDWLALVGDSADGFPGLPGWGAKSAATVLARYGSIDDIPEPPWDVTVRGEAKLAATLAEARDAALLFRVLATLRTDGDVGDVDDWLWTGPAPEFAAWSERLGSARLLQRAEALSRARAA